MHSLLLPDQRAQRDIACSIVFDATLVWVPSLRALALGSVEQATAVVRAWRVRRARRVGEVVQMVDNKASGSRNLGTPVAHMFYNVFLCTSLLIIYMPMEDDTLG